MRHWLQLATRNWWRKPGRTLTTVTAIGIGAGLVVAVMTCYASARSAIDAYLGTALGKSDVHVELKGRTDNLLPESLVTELRQLPQQRAVVPRLKRLMEVGGPRQAPPITRQTVDGPITTRPRGGLPYGYRITAEIAGVTPDEVLVRPVKIETGGRMIGSGESAVSVCEDDLADDFSLEPGHQLLIFGESEPPLVTSLIGITHRPRMGRMTRPTLFVPLADLQRLAGRPGEIETIDLLAKDGRIMELQTAVEQVMQRYRQKLGEDLRKLETEIETLQKRIMEREAKLQPLASASRTQPSRTTLPPSDAELNRLTHELTGQAARYETLRSRFFAAANIQVSTRDSKVSKVNQNLGLLNLVLQLTGCVALVAATFIIFSTLNMGVIERTGQLGVLRCLGMTRAQVAGLVFAEALPLGAIGILLGVPGGIGLAYLAVHFDDILPKIGLGRYATGLPSIFGDFTIHWGGVTLAVVGGLAATILAALLPAIHAARISPQEASHPLAKPDRSGWVWLALLLGAAAFGLQAALMFYLSGANAAQFHLLVGIPVMIVSLALMMPGVIAILMRLLSRPIGWLLGLHPQLLVEQFGRTHWRSAGIVCSIMVGLALMVHLRVDVESIMSVVQLPKKFPSAMAWCWEPATIARIQEVKGRIYGVKDLTAMATTDVEIMDLSKEQTAGIWRMLSQSKPVAHLVAAEPDEWDQIFCVDFLEGDFESCKKLFRSGQGAIVTKEFAQLYKKKLGDELVFRRPAGSDQIGRSLMGGLFGRPPPEGKTPKSEDATVVRYKVAGVVTSPAVEVVGDFFDQRQAIQERAYGGVIVSRKNGLNDFGLYYAPMLFFNFDYDKIGPKADDAERRRLEELAFQNLRRTLKSNQVFTLNASRAKEILETDVRMVFRWLTLAAVIALASAAIGSANVMLANVMSRRRSFAILRAVGTTRWQIIRLVFGEAIVLGLVGTLVGCFLGFYLALAGHHLTHTLFGFKPQFVVPWMDVAAAGGVTVLACLLAAVTPARLAARHNVMESMRV